MHLSSLNLSSFATIPEDGRHKMRAPPSALGRHLAKTFMPCSWQANIPERMPQRRAQDALDSKTLEHGCSIVRAGVPSFFALGSNLLASTARICLKAQGRDKK